MAKRQKVPVSVRAAIQRINRKLKPDMEQLKVTRGGEMLRLDLGDYYIINFNRNWIAHKHVDPEKLGRELGVLAPWETMVDDD